MEGHLHLQLPNLVSSNWESDRTPIVRGSLCAGGKIAFDTEEETMKVQDVMTKSVASCRPDANLAAVTALMWKHNCGQLPVVNDEGKVTAVITDRDICIALGTRNERPCDLRVCDVTYRTPAVCHGDDDLRAALKIMAAERVRRLPVVDHQATLVGILSLDDITLHARHHGDTDRPPVSFEDVMRTLRAIYYRGPRLQGPRSAPT
jgi:CBS domain-containing protein